MICSDGVSDYQPDDAIADVLRGAGDPQAAADETVRLALDAGSRDNVTAAGADVVAVVTVVDRKTGAQAAVEAAGYRWRSVIDLDDLGLSPQ